MLEGISNTTISLPLAASIGCTTAGLYIGRKWCLAAVYKFGSIGANLVASKKGSEWNQTSNEYWIRAKKNAARDLTAAISLIAIGLISGYAEEKALPKEEISFLQNCKEYAWSAMGVYFLGRVPLGILATVSDACFEVYVEHLYSNL